MSGATLAPWEEAEQTSAAQLAPWEEAAKAAPAPRPLNPPQPAQLPTGTVQAAPQPGILDRARASVANSLVGRAFGMEPTETEEEQQRTGDRTQLPQLPDWANKPLPAPGATTPIQKATEQQIGQFRAQHPTIGGVEKGVETTAEGLRSPANLALLAAAPESRIISAFFASQAAKGAYDSAEQAYQAFRQGKNAEAAQYATEAGLSGIVGALAGRHALKGAFPVDTGRPSVTEPTQVPREPARLGAGPQPEYQGEPQAPPQPAGIPDAEVAPWEEAARAQLTAKAGPTNDRTTPPPVNPDTARTRVAPTQFAQPAAVPDRGVLVDPQGNALVSRPGLPPPVETAGRKTPIIPSPAKPAPPVQTAPTPPPQMGSQAAMVRPTVQASTAPEAVRQSAEGQQPQLEGIVKQVAAGVPGAELEGSRVKTADSIANKEDRGKPVETTTDVLGARISAPAEAQPQLEAKIEQQLPVVSKDKIDSNGLEATQYGVKTGKPGEPNQVSELQVVTPEQATAMKATDDLYDQQKKALAAGDKAKADEIGKQIAAKFEEAQKPFAPIKGSRIQLQDGRPGVVNYVEPNRPLARVTLDDGTKMPMVPLRALSAETKAPVPEPQAGETQPEAKGDKWIGVDLDGTLAHYDGWKGKTNIGEPVPPMVERVKQWLAEGNNVKVLTARVSDDPDGAAKKAIQDWTEQHLGQRLDVTDVKDSHMTHLYDDRAVPVERNTGKLLAQPQPEKDQAVELGPGVKVTRQNEVEGQTKFKFGNTQADIPADSEAAKALGRVQKAIDPADLVGTVNGAEGGLETTPHVTVRYGIKGEDTAGIVAFLEKQSPFEASLGATQAFPASEHSDGAVPIIAPVESPDLDRLEAELDKHGDFKERSFPEYRPHSTIAYVRPEAAKKYTGLTGTEGKTFTVEHISITDKSGAVRQVKLLGVSKSLLQSGHGENNEKSARQNVGGGSRSNDRESDASGGLPDNQSHTVTTEASPSGREKAVDRSPGRVSGEGRSDTEGEGRAPQVRAGQVRELAASGTDNEAGTREVARPTQDALRQGSPVQQEGQANRLERVPEVRSREDARLSGSDTRTYEAVQRDIDAEEDKLEASGQQVTRLYFPEHADVLSKAEGWNPMPQNLVKLYAERDAIGAAQLKQSIAEIENALKQAGVSEEAEMRRVLDYYSLDRSRTDAAKQYLASQYTKGAVDKAPKEQVADIYSALAPLRNVFMDDRDDLWRDRQLTRDSIAIVRAVVGYFNGGEAPEIKGILPERAADVKPRNSSVTPPAPEAGGERSQEHALGKQSAAKVGEFASGEEGAGQPSKSERVQPSDESKRITGKEGQAKPLGEPERGQEQEVTKPNKSPKVETYQERFKRAVQAKADKYLDTKVRRPNGDILTHRQIIDERMAQGGKTSVKMIQDDAAERKLDREIGAMRKTGVPTGNEMHPTTIKYRKLLAEQKAGIKVPSYRITVPDGTEWVIPKTEYDYAKSKEMATHATKPEKIETPLDKFEKEGKSPYEITKKEWVELQKAHRRSLGQPEDSGTRYAPTADYEEYHRDSVKTALKMGLDVPGKVLKDYPDLEATREGRTVDHNGWKITANIATGSWTVKSPDGKTVTTAAPTLEAGKEIADKYLSKPVQATPEGVTKQEGAEGKPIPKGAVELTPQTEVPKSGRNFEGRYLQAALEPAKEKWDKTLEKIPEVGFSEPKTSNGTESLRAQLLTGEYPQPTLVLSRRGTGNWSITFEDYHTEPGSKSPIKVSQEIGQTGTLKLAKEVAEGRLRSGTYYDPTIPVKAGFRIVKGYEGPENLKELKPKGLTADKLVVQVPGDGRFTIPNNPAAIDGAIAKADKFVPPGPDKVIATRIPKAPAEFDVPRRIKDLERQLEEHETDVRRAQRENKQFDAEYHNSNIKAIKEEIAELKNAPKEGPPAKPDVSGTFYAGGFLDPELFKVLFPDIAQRVSDWATEKHTPGAEQRAMMRETRGERDRMLGIVAKKLEGPQRSWIFRSRDDSKAFFNAVESGQIDTLPSRDQALAKLFRGAFDQMRGELQDLNPNILADYIENYFPHIWQHPSMAAQTIRSIISGKRPFAGKGSFLKQRTIPTIQDGLDMGLTPVSWNPVDLFLRKYSEMGQFLMAQKTLKMMKEAGTVKMVRIGEKAPEGWQRLDDRIGQVHSYDDEGHLYIRANYYAPPDAAKVFNNYVSRGLAGRSGIYDTLRWANNNLNSLQLGISAFHASTTAINAATSEVALGIQQLFEGKPFTAAGHFISGGTIAPSVIRTMVNGSRMMREYLDPGSYKKMEAEASAVAEAGGRARMDMVQMKALDKTINAFRNGSIGEGLLSLPGTVLQTTIAPVMDWMVPRMKLGAFYDMAHDIFDQGGRNNWSEEQIRGKLQRAWDSIDNRFGQLVYENLFWHKGLQDTLMLASRSVGWNFGDLRELGGAAADVGKQAAKAATGKMPEVTPRMAFAFALPLVTGLVGAVLTYLWTGQKPDTWKDYFYPKRKDGTRVSIPGYMKDVIAIGKHPLDTVVGKMSPLLSLTAEAINNRDFYGTEIRHKDDPPVKQMIEVAKWAAAQATPFSFSGTKKLLEKKGADTSTVGSTLKAAAENLGEVALGQLGFQPAPASIQNSAALNKAREYEQENMPSGTKTAEEAKRTQAMHTIEDMYHRGDVHKETIDAMKSQGVLREQDILRARLYSRTDPLTRAVRSLTGHPEQVLNVYKEADPGEQKLLRPLVEAESRKLQNMPMQPEQKDALRKAFRDALNPSLAQLRSKAS